MRIKIRNPTFCRSNNEIVKNTIFKDPYLWLLPFPPPPYGTSTPAKV